MDLLVVALVALSVTLLVSILVLLACCGALVAILAGAGVFIVRTHGLRRIGL
jgi:hypothetical protein